MSIILSSCNKEDPRVLVFTKTAGFYHSSIPGGVEAIQKLGEENEFEVDTTENADKFTEENLQKYAAVIFLNTTGDVLDRDQEVDFERFIQAGGGFLGIHSAADTEYYWGWYGELVGGYFSDHPGINDPHPNVQEGVLEIVDEQSSFTDFLPAQWTRTDEWYSYKDLLDDLNILLTIDEESYQGGVNMGNHPMAWYREFDGGRAFYTGLGHTEESYEEELFLNHLYKGIEFAIGPNRLDYSKTRTNRAPEENRFTKTELSTGEFYEPMEMSILPNKNVLITQRRGEIMLYKNDDDTLTQAGYLDVYHQTDVEDVNAEEGLIGITADPDFENNDYVFIFYSPADASVNRLSRFMLVDDKLDMESETTVLEFESKRDICCHTGGSLAFDNKGLLYISTGDNSTPFNQPDQEHQLDGYAPLDDRPGFEQYDARRTAGNSNDLRGKILRIKVNEDGSYDIPGGNLYPEGMEKTQPEIYVQGTRNPYRISIDPKSNHLYWGDVGPDARADSVGVRGSLGYDEINVATEAGHYGWPFFVGNNFPYNEYDYATGTPGEVFDPQNPVNNSTNNTGLMELPPTKPAFLWYPYTESGEFPMVGTGGRNAMAGPVFYSDLYPGDAGLPEYFDGKLFIYDWVRDWIRVVTMGEEGEFSKMERFMDQTTFNAIIDMELGPDGHLYLLEYGKGWFSKNSDSGLSRIDFNPGNRAPVIHGIQADKNSGLLPFEVLFTADAMDLENDPMTYTWTLSTGDEIETDEPGLEYTFDEAGDYEVSVEVRDSNNLSAESNAISIYAGNAAPEVSIDIRGNRTFYFPGKQVEYSLSVKDEKEDGVSNQMNTENLFVSANYIEATEQLDETEGPDGHLVFTDVLAGKNLVSTLGCRACHHQVNTSAGPSYTSIADRYKNEDDAESYLANSIIQGSSGVWGEAAMPSHSDLPEEDAYQIVAWIQSLVDEDELEESLPAEGSLQSTLGEEPMDNGLLVISATYSDEGGENIKSLSGHQSVSLKNSRISMTEAVDLQGFNAMEFGGNTLLLVPSDPGSFKLNSIDLTGIKTIELTVGSQEPVGHGYSFEVRLGSPDGRSIGSGIAKPDEEGPMEGIYQQIVTLETESVIDGDLHDLYITSHPENPDESATIALTGVEFIPEDI